MIEGGDVGKVLREPVEYVRTRNATPKEPMLRLNEKLGFKPVVQSSVWQVELTRVMSYFRGGAPR